MSENTSILKVQDTLPCGCVLTMSIKQEVINAWREIMGICRECRMKPELTGA